MEAGFVSNVQRYSLQDGPGIRTTVFLKGCPLKCAWCHNPESMARRPQVVLLEARCLRCGACVGVCPQHQALERSRGLGAADDCHTAIDVLNSAGPCVLCGACIEACPTGAREMVGQRMTVPQVIEAIRADRIFYDDSGGGVTFSGGEPLLQSAFLGGLLRACRAEGIHTAVDTSGFASDSVLRTIAGLADLVLYDLKFIDDGGHVEFCGVSNRQILVNLETLDRIHRNIWIRIPVIPGINDRPEELTAMVRFIGRLSSVRQVNLLPYHRTGVHKFQRLGKPYLLANITPPSAEYMEAVAARFADAGLNIKIGG